MDIMLTPAEERDLVVRAHDGDDNAMTTLLARFEPIIQKVARRQRGVEFDADDAAQTARIAIIEAVRGGQLRDGLLSVNVASIIGRAISFGAARAVSEQSRVAVVHVRRALARHGDDMDAVAAAVKGRVGADMAHGIVASLRAVSMTSVEETLSNGSIVTPDPHPAAETWHALNDLVAVAGLTEAEALVIREVRGGRDLREIATQTGIPKTTVLRHRDRAIAKMRAAASQGWEVAA